MKYDPNIHKRRSIRLKGYDYSQSGMYFITICCLNKACLLGNIVASNPDRLETSESKMILNEYGKIAYDEWMKTAEKRANIELDVFVVMPNHIHGIIIINDCRGVLNTPNTDLQCDDVSNKQSNNEFEYISGNENGPVKGVFNTPLHSPSNNLASIIRGYKSAVTKQLNDLGFVGSIWQRNYYEHIIRNEKSYEKISDYIINNPLHWEQDRFFKKY